MQPSRFAAVLGLALLALPTGASAQAQFEVTAFAGAAIFASDLTDVFTDGTFEAVQSHDNAIAFGAHAGARFGALSVEATISVVPTELVTEVTGLTPAGEDQTILMFGVNGLYTLGGDFFEPFITAGVGLKSYSADDPTGGFESGSDPSFNVGVGGRLWISESAAIRIDLRDYISSFDAFENLPGAGDAKLQNDLLLTVGISFTGGGS